MNTAVIYCRLSSPNQSFVNNIHVSLENQSEACKKYCTEKSFNIVNEVHEIKSSKNMNNLENLKGILNRYSNTNLVIYNVTRFSRNIFQGLKFIEDFSKKNITIHFVEEIAKTDHHLDMHRIRLGLSQSEYESDTISHRIKTNNKVLKAKGWKFGKVPFGKSVVSKNGIRSFKISEFEEDIIRFIRCARVSPTTKELNKLLVKIANEEDVIKNPIIFIDNEKNCLINEFTRIFTLTFSEIADLLNSYDVKNRNLQWTASSVSRIYRLNDCITKISNGISNKMTI